MFQPYLQSGRIRLCGNKICPDDLPDNLTPGDKVIQVRKNFEIPRKPETLILG